MTGSKKPLTLAFYGAAGFEQNKTGFQFAALRRERSCPTELARRGDRRIGITDDAAARGPRADVRAIHARGDPDRA